MGSGSSSSKPKKASANETGSKPPYNFYKDESKSAADNLAGVEDTVKNDAEETEAEKIVQPLEVQELNVRSLSNKFMHNTLEYEHENLIIRRGQDFKIFVKFKNDYNEATDRVRIKLTVGDRPLKTKGTLIELLVADQKLSPDEWGAICEEKNGTDVTFTIMPAADAIVGSYKLFIDTRRTIEGTEKVKRRVYKHSEDIIILFNAWCPNDVVYLEKGEERDEYVLNETGRIYTSASLWSKGRAWNFGQFEKECLDSALYILAASKMPYEAMGNPVRVVRTISAMVNSNDATGGILTGNWSGDYSGGRSPTSWNGSVAILEEFSKTKKAVNYGQCWVFSGVSTTVCRALGIPCRSVTNFSSAHDQDESMTIDYFVDCNGTPLKINSDSIWNFHVWNEAWFSRPDLPKGNDGWQAFDATPQERSDGQFQCGPCPVAAIKRGDVYLNYDAKFIFAEVNGDKVTWMLNAEMVGDDGDVLMWMENGEPDMKAVSVDDDDVGQTISTKMVGKTEREVITNTYKSKEGSKKERMVASSVSVHSSRQKELAVLYEHEKNYDVKFDFEADMDKKGNMKVKVNIKNNAKESRNLTLRTHGRVKYYAGNPGNDLGYGIWETELLSGGEETFEYEILAKEYMNTMKDDGSVVIQTTGKVAGTGQVFSKVVERKIDDPDLDIKSDKSSLRKGEDFEVTVSFTNPLDIPLTECELSLEGPGIQRTKKVPVKKTIDANETIEIKQKLTAGYKGKRELIGSLSSKQLRGITGSVQIEVLPPEEKATEGGTEPGGITTA